MSVSKGAWRASFPLFAAIVFALVTAWVYWPGISGPSLLDDRTSLLTIADVHAEPELAWEYIVGDRSGALGRAVSMASFVVEKMLFDEGIAGFKRTNIVLHCVIGLLFIALLWQLFAWRQVPQHRWLAVLLGGIWLLHPLLVSTVLYAVQRMAMLSTFFVLLTLLVYLMWRHRVVAGRVNAAIHWAFAALAGSCFLLGMMSKENTIVALPLILLMELWWLECRGRDGAINQRWYRRLSVVAVLGALAGLAIFVFGYDSFAQRMGRRPFTLDERLWSQARIVWEYVGQLVTPDITGMGIYHDDYLVSTGWWEPVSTGYALLAWAGVLVVSLLLLRRPIGRMAVFGVAVFVVGHSVESTVLSLEMMFEHRNYFPSMGLLIVLGVVYSAVTLRWSEPARPMLLCLAWLPLVLAGMTTSLAQVWSNRSLLAVHHVAGHPTSTRANNDMAVELARRGDAEAAYRYSYAAHLGSANLASTGERIDDYHIRNLALSCTARQPPPPDALDGFGERNAGRPLSSVTTLLTMVRFLQNDECPQVDRLAFADRMAEVYLRDDAMRGAQKLYISLAILENALERFDLARDYIERVLARAPNHSQSLLMKLHFATAQQDQAGISEARERLLRQRDEGRLTTTQARTLALYLENPALEN